MLYKPGGEAREGAETKRAEGAETKRGEGTDAKRGDGGDDPESRRVGDQKRRKEITRRERTETTRRERRPKNGGSNKSRPDPMDIPQIPLHTPLRFQIYVEVLYKYITGGSSL